MRYCEWCGHAIEQRAHKARLTGALVRRHCDQCDGCADADARMPAWRRNLAARDDSASIRATNGYNG